MTVVDTDILIDVGRGVPAAIDLLKEIKANSTLAIAFVSKNQRDYRFISGLNLLPYP